MPTASPTMTAIPVTVTPLPACDANRFICVKVVLATLGIGEVRGSFEHLDGEGNTDSVTTFVVTEQNPVTIIVAAGESVIRSTAIGATNQERVTHLAWMELPTTPSGLKSTAAKVLGGGNPSSWVGVIGDYLETYVGANYDGGNTVAVIGFTRKPGNPYPLPRAIPLASGWNLFALPGQEMQGRYTASLLLSEINRQGGGATEICRWYAGGWSCHVKGLPFNDFAIELGKGYFIKATRPSTFKP